VTGWLVPTQFTSEESCDELPRLSFLPSEVARLWMWARVSFSYNCLGAWLPEIRISGTFAARAWRGFASAVSKNTTMKTTMSAAVLITGLLSTVVSGNVSAVPILYTDFVGDVADGHRHHDVQLHIAFRMSRANFS
jgi:hypothetical protein